MLHRTLSICTLASILLASGLPAVAQPAQPQAPDSLKESLRIQSEQFQSRVDAAARAVENEPRLKRLSHQQRKDLIEFIAGNMLFTLTHELGHALISEMGLYVLGREEDAADSFAVIGMLSVGTVVSQRVLGAASTGWFMSDKRNQAQGIELAFYDEHGLDRQRAYQIVCLMVGSDPDRFEELAKTTKLPEERQETCQGDYSNASWSWTTAMKPHLRAPDQPKQRIDTVYGPGDAQYAAFAQAFRTVGLLELAANFAADRYVWRRPITLEMQMCGKPAAHWDLSKAKITICYEMGLDFAMLYRDYGLTGLNVPPPPAKNKKTDHAPNKGTNSR